MKRDQINSAPEQNRSLHMLYLRLWKHLSRRQKKQLILIFFLILGAAVAEVATVSAVVPFLGALTSPDKLVEQSLFRPLLNMYPTENNQDILLPLTILFCSVISIAATIRILLVWTQTHVSRTIGTTWSCKIYEQTLYQPFSTHLRRNTSEIISGVQKGSELSTNAIFPALNMLGSACILITIFVALIAINTRVAIATFLGLSLIYLTIIYSTKRLVYKNSRTIAHNAVSVNKSLQEGLGGIREVLIDGTQQFYARIFRQSMFPLHRALASNQAAGQYPRYAIEALGMILIATLAFLSGNQTGEQSNIIPAVGALALGIQRILPIAQQIYASYLSIRGSEVGILDALELLDQKPPRYSSNSNVGPLHFNDSIELKGLSYSYNGHPPFVLSDVNFKIKKGARVGIIGATGSGKSTLLDIIMGLLEPTNGIILIDGIAITSRNIRQWQKRLAHVPQTIFLADSTIAENIALGIPADSIDFSRVERAAVTAQISDTIESLPDRYLTTVGERGIRLSGGQRQRLGIARALYKNADVIILDEATSALDYTTETAVMAEFGALNQNLTILIAAHRVSTLKECDLIIDLTKVHTNPPDR